LERAIWAFAQDPFSFPVYLSSVALQKLGHDDGELAWIRACHNQQV
jgi:isopentenyl diphosphate isomerase/L-lactate dehydrogenase-like FMN-dependent dehydrogenase